MGADEAVFVRRALSFLLLPPLGLAWLALLALVVGAAWRRMRGAAGVVACLALAGMLLMSTPWAAVGLIDSLEHRAGPGLDEDAVRRMARGAQGPRAVVVLGGGIRSDSREAFGPQVPRELTFERLRGAARIARWSGLPIAVSGGSPLGVLHPEAQAMAEVLANDFGVRPRWVETDSLDTASNARHSARILGAAGIGRVILVTHAYHMPRARAAFEAVGLKVEAAPIGFLAGRGAPQPLAFVPSARGFQLASLAVHEWIGIAWYRFSGRIAVTP
ncbi:MAG: YdcF family protein [Burkholderiaceae bacterium]|nr:YdcF family protein [Burkholderiaceae bacterium]